MAIDIYYKSDRKLLLTANDLGKNDFDFTAVNWRLELFTTNGKKRFTVTHTDGTFTNCTPQLAGGLLVYLNNHGMPPGHLSAELHIFIPDNNFPDGYEDVMTFHALGIRLVPWQDSEPETLTAQIVVPLFIGDLQLLEHNIGGAIDAVNRELEALLGREPVNRPTDTTPKAAAPQQVVLRRGYIPAFAAPGNAYRVEEVEPGICKTRLYLGEKKLTINFGRLFPERDNDSCRIVDIKASADSIIIDREAKTATTTDYRPFQKAEYIEITFTMPHDPNAIGCYRSRVVTVDNTGAIMPLDESRTMRPGIDTSQLPDHMPFADFWQLMCALRCDAQYWKRKRKRRSLLNLTPEGIRDYYDVARPRWYKFHYSENDLLHTPDPIGVYNQRYLRVRIRTRSRVSAWAYYVLIRDGKGGYWYKRIQK